MSPHTEIQPTQVSRLKHKRSTKLEATRRETANARASQLADIAGSGDNDNAECAAADLAREFPSHAP
jgi:hypothetical protein